MEPELFTGDTSKDNHSSEDSHSPGYNPCKPFLYGASYHTKAIFLHFCVIDESSCPQNFLLLESRSYRKKTKIARTNEFFLQDKFSQ